MEQVDRIVGSPQFSNSPKLSDFLKFVVTEHLQGRKDRIKAVTIAHSVYQRGEDFEPLSDPIVRVEAGRLRTRLSEFYSDIGATDPIVIEIPKGAYVPLITRRSEHDPEPEAHAPPETIGPQKFHKLRSWQIAAIGSAAAIVGFLIAALLFDFRAQEREMHPRFTESTEAYALFWEARTVGRPPTIEARVLAAMELARAAQALDPSFGGGYAAESFQLWQYVQFGHSKAPDADARRAVELAQQAIEIDPEFGWGYQSLSRAMHLLGDLEGAVIAAQQAVELSPNSAEQLGNLGLTLAVTGRSADAMAPLKEAIQLAKGNVRRPYLNYLAIAQFHNREFAESAATIERNRDIGGPMGPHMYAYLAAAHEMAGNEGHARAFAEMVRKNKSGFSTGHFLEGLIKIPDDRELLFSALEKSGLAPEDL
ncbi:hypothetical protein [Shimia abyssi]|uniref:Uncharacterized protein n=1 Tax=Shimia abyssi TaxID=1662395 RepID=A0A2P8EYI1_9RHOB|nr:hypothetical protein [Shimia abyssi]PSL14528.1 hypothetical protein CLV88_1285 [Shimia abyssi]